MCLLRTARKHVCCNKWPRDTTFMSKYRKYHDVIYEYSSSKIKPIQCTEKESSFANFWENHGKEVVQCWDKQCSKRPCQERLLKFAVRELNQKYNHPQTMSVLLHVYYQTKFVTTITEQKVFDALGILSDLGGTMGVMIGGTLFSFLQLLDFFVVRIMGGRNNMSVAQEGRRVFPRNLNRQAWTS